MSPDRGPASHEVLRALDARARAGSQPGAREDGLRIALADFAAVLASPVEFHPLATDAATGQSTDLRPFIGNPPELRLAAPSCVPPSKPAAPPSSPRSRAPQPAPPQISGMAPAD